MAEENSIAIRPFTPDAFVQLAQNGSAESPEQLRYIAGYCDSLGARTMVVESHYVDRHYTDEYALYYSRMLRPPPSVVRRVHFFTHSLTQEEFDAELRKAFGSAAARDEVEKRLRAPTSDRPDVAGYLGFVSLRPISAVPVGRTILERLPESGGGRRDIWTVNEHSAHIGNLRLPVEGLAFQQQDVAVGACATAALWSALVQVARTEGMRAPTPAEISAAAVGAARGRGLPANTGLTVHQLCDATRACGFHPEVVSGHEKIEILVLAMHTYLLSGIPVVIALRGNGSEGHAVTAAGFQLVSEHPLLQASIPVRSARMTKLYVHDDRLGPYARAFITPYVHPELELLTFEIQFTNNDAELWSIDSIVAPVYPKLRLHVQSLIALAEYKGSTVETIVGDEAPKLRVDLRYERAGTYLRRLTGRVLDPTLAAQFAQRVILSRWCGVVRWYLDDVELLEFVYDTTDIVRSVETASLDLLRGVVALHPAHAVRVRSVGNALNVPTA